MDDWKTDMTDMEMICFAKAAAIMAIGCHAADNVLEPEYFFDDSQDAVCLAQQLVAEAHGLVGEGDI